MPALLFEGGDAALCARHGARRGQATRREAMISIHSPSGSPFNLVTVTTPFGKAFTRVRTLATSAGVKSAVTSAN